jgi:microcystin-dependent protein
MATVTPGKVFTSNEIVTPANLNLLGTPSVVIASNEVTMAKIADAAVTTAKIADGAVTQAKLNSSVTLVPTGAVMPFAMNTAPSGWLAADGLEYSKTGTYSALFASIGITYGETNGSGGAGTSHFRVPDLRGIFIRGASSQTISGITYSGTLGTKQGDAMQGHRHSPTSFNSVGSGGNIPNTGSFMYSAASNVIGDPITDGTNGTPRTGSETRPANIALLYCIKF